MEWKGKKCSEETERPDRVYKRKKDLNVNNSFNEVPRRETKVYSVVPRPP